MTQDELNFHSVKFTSRYTRIPQPRFGENDENILLNQEFPLEFVLPSIDANREKERHLVILVNGFAEPSVALYRHAQLGLARLLADQGIASVLVPIPLHLFRIPETSVYDRIAKIAQKRLDPNLTRESAVPYHVIKQSPERFYLGYRQLLSDLSHLARGIRLSDSSPRDYSVHNPVFREWFDESTRIHLLGYSLGGLGCLSAFLRNRTLEKEYGHDRLFETCTLLCSGPTFMDLVPQKLRFKSEDWDELRSYYYSRVFEVKRQEAEKKLESGQGHLAEAKQAGEKSGLLAKVNSIKQINTVNSLAYIFFERIVLGVPWDSRDLHEASNHILAVLGTSDLVVPPETLFGLRPRDRHFAVLHVPALEHVFIETQTWKQWGPFVVSSIVHFIQNHPKAVSPLQS
ncbi:MAG: hypothetical protein KJ970_18555 [Candidatus Eisenbacteria bacterium]|uniref:Alpha/beta hydrolase n=1 Tax=Eiseniibacteriota bacterium TaxID=2212470 RepID=A0A948S0F9_UNCEI|nr:hypothetical protein [Candidatus Eisenbacteria bacterium]MBU1949304.1 hypothetical protein [Candidatus Eisenbacteria bacterium]MBU2692924.1 hypothetical protein [Candidatus Eisenbacteria bacterium]